MTARAFFNKVVQMREAQRIYQRTRSAAAFTQSKSLESEVDAEIARVNAILEDQKPQQGNLFDNK